jgi:hypothetical protein
LRIFFFSQIQIKFSLRVLCTFVLLSLSACNNPLVGENDSQISSGYKPGLVPNPDVSGPTNSTSTDFSISSGATVRSKGSAVAAQVALSFQQQKVKGSALSARISLNSGRQSQ